MTACYPGDDMGCVRQQGMLALSIYEERKKHEMIN